MAATANDDVRAVRRATRGIVRLVRAFAVLLRPASSPSRSDRLATRPREVTIVHSDIVSSTRLIETAGSAYPRMLVRHRALIARAVERAGGRFLAHAGDGTLAVFDRADAAVLAAAEAQRALLAERWPGGFAVRVRMGVHTGEVYEVAGEPVGLAVHHGARIMAAAQPGQVVLSTEAAVAARLAGVDRLHPSSVRDAGWHFVRDHPAPVHLRQLVADGLTVVLPDRERPPSAASDAMARARRSPASGAAG
jgi:class 3 adenylate cyclase